MTNPHIPAYETTEPGAIVFLPDPTDGFTDDEIYSMFSSSGELVTEDETPIVAAADVQEGAMIALIPRGEDLDRLVLPDGEPLDQLHLTLCYLGDAADIDDMERQDILDDVANLAQGYGPLALNAFAPAWFNPEGEEPCLVLIVGGNDLESLQSDVLGLVDELGVDIPDQHLPFVGHVTLRYTPAGWTPDLATMNDLAVRTGPLIFDRIRVAFGGVITDYDLVPQDVPADVTAAVDEDFHLMGKHDQRTHGGHTSSEDARIAQKLNGGGKLDPKVESERRVLVGISSWTHSGTGSAHAKPGEELGGSMEDSVAHAALHNAEDTSVAGDFARAVAAAPPGAPALHRGHRDVMPSKVPREGDTMDITPSSFSRDASVAEGFALGNSKHGLRPGVPHGHQVIMHVEPGSRAMRIDQHSGHYSWEKEHVAMGRYQVTGRKDSVRTIKIAGGQKVQVTVTDLQVRQVDFTDSPPSFSRDVAGLGDTGG